MSVGTFLMIFFGVIIAIAAPILWYLNAKERDATDRIREKIGQDAHIFVSAWDGSCIGISFQRRKLAIGRYPQLTEIDFSQVVSADLCENNTVVQSTNTGSMLTRAVVGGVLLGGVGALGGALTAKTRAISNLNELTLRVTTDTSAFRVKFLDLNNTGQALPGQTLDFVRQQADGFYASVLQAIKIAEADRAAE
jgi:hypothetical protein